MKFTVKAFDELTSEELYEIIKLRLEVFVGEQGCSYEDLDNKDKQCYHIFTYDADEVVAYSRILPAGLSYEEPSLGRVVVSKKQRGTGLGHQMIKEAIQFMQEHFEDDQVKISAQSHAIRFYERLGFEAVSEEYLEENIPHKKMTLKLK